MQENGKGYNVIKSSAPGGEKEGEIMEEMQRDALSNSLMQQASKVLSEARRHLKDGAYTQAADRGWDSMVLAMRSVLALDDITEQEDLKAGEAFRQMYLKSEAMPSEWASLLDQMLQWKDREKEGQQPLSKEQAGRMISRLQGFLQGAVDYLVQRNAPYWG